MPRLFTGLEIPLDIAQSLARFKSPLSGARWIEPEDYHVTLCFVGDIDYAAARDLAGMLDVARPRGSVTLTLDRLDAFGGNEPRSLFAGVAPSQILNELQADQERLMRRLKLPLDKRKFTPHVTLARLRGTPAAEVAHFIAGQGAFRPLTFTARRFVLFSSKPSTGGGPYVQEATYSLL